MITLESDRRHRDCGAAISQSTTASAQESITDPERIRAIVMALSSIPASGIARHPLRAVSIELERFEREAVHVAFRAVGGDVGVMPSGPLEIDVSGYNSVYRMWVAEIVDSDGRTNFPLPDLIVRIRHRYCRRVRPEPELHALVVHPLWPELPLADCRVANLSFGGLGIECHSDHLLFPGLLLPSIALTIDGGPEIILSGHVRHIQEGPGKRQRCGIAIDPIHGNDEARWVKCVSQSLGPATRLGEHVTEGLWDLFERSGYFNLAGRNAADFADQKSGFIDVSRRAGDAPQIFCQAVWPSSRGVEATISCLKAYHHSWMGHQAARLPGVPPSGAGDAGRILCETYLRAHEHAQHDPEFRWVMGYVEPEVPWIERSHIEFARRHADDDQAMTMPTRMMTVVCAELGDVGDATIEVGPANADEIFQLSQSLKSSRPNCYVEALDLVHERMDMSGLSRQWANLGFQRERAIVSARRHGRPIAMAVLELGELGTNLFRLLDGVRLFALAPDGKDAFVALIAAARRWYAGHGRTSFLFFREDADWSYAEAAGLHDLSEPHLWILSSRLMPDFLEYVFELTGSNRRRQRSDKELLT